MVLRYSPGFYPFSNPSPGTHPGPSLVLAQISIFLIPARILNFGTLQDPTFPVLAQIPHFWYSPGFPIFGTRSDFYLSSTHPDSPFPVLTRIPHFRYSPGFLPFRYSPGFPIFGTLPDPTFSVLAQIPHFRYSPGSYLSRYSSGSPTSGTLPDPTFSGNHRDFPFPVLTRILTSPILARIPHFRYSPGFYLLGTHPDPTFSVLARIPHFRYSPRSPIFGTLPDPTFSGTHPDFTFPVLARITLLQYSPGFHLFGTHWDSTFSDTHSYSTFFGDCPDLSLYLARISSSSPASPRISLSFPELCPDHSSSQASCLVFFKSFNWSDSVPLVFGTK